MSQTSITPSSLWEFSLQLYARPGVADTCIELQDQRGANVNILLWCVWLAARGQLLDSSEVQAAKQCIHAWDERYVSPLRQLRRQMKADFGVDDPQIEAVRQQIKQAELQAEQQLLFRLEALARSWASTAHHAINAGDNIRCYLHSLGLTDAQMVQTVGVLTAVPKNDLKT